MERDFLDKMQSAYGKNGKKEDKTGKHITSKGITTKPTPNQILNHIQKQSTKKD